MTTEKGGRPLKFKTPEEMQEKIDNYFKECIENNEPPVITGLAIALNTTRQGLIDYQNRDEFHDTIKKAKLRCENFAEKQLFRGKQVAGVIFNLKNNYGWVDKQEVITKNADAKDISTLTEEEIEAELEEMKRKKRKEKCIKL